MLQIHDEDVSDWSVDYNSVPCQLSLQMVFRNRNRGLIVRGTIK